MIWREPYRYDDFIHMFCFLDPRDRATLIDVGANVGAFTADFLKFFPNANVFAFEPTSKPFDRLRTRLESDERVRIFKYALGHEEGSKEINIAERDTLSSFLSYTDDANEHRKLEFATRETVTCRRFDTLDVPLAAGSRIVVKIDVQGLEAEVVEGFGDRLNDVDLVLIEVRFVPEYKNRGPSFAPVCNILSRFGLHPVIFQRYGRGDYNTHAIVRDVIFVRETLLQKVYWKYY